jgi:trk system potassium uptake protein TrkA
MKVIVVGGGKIGEALSRTLVKERHDVVLIEKNEGLAEELAENLDVLVLHGDGSDKGLLKDASIDSSDVVIAATSDDKTNMAVCEFAKNAKVPNIISRVNHAGSEKDFAKIGIESIIDATATAVLAFKKAMERGGKPLVSFVAGGKGEIFEINIRNDSKAAGKTVAEVAKDFAIACIYRDGKMIIPKPEMKIKEGDILTICVSLEDVKKIEGMF